MIRGPLLAVESPSFWGVGVHTNLSNGIWTDPTVRGFLNATPFRWFRYGTETEACNVTANIDYGDNGSPLAGGCAYNVTAFKLWCQGQTPTCHSILPLPGENNNSAEDAYIAQWIVHAVGYQPDYWWIGNEPSLWDHYGIPWANWSTADHSTPTPLAYAVGLRSAIRAVSKVDPGARFIGLESTSSNDRAWFQEIVRIDGPLIGAIAYHSYPSGGSTNETLSQFLAPLHGSKNITSTYAAVRSDIAGLCSRCGTLPIFLHEYNAGPGYAPSNFGGTYANALFLAASTTQALKANVSQFSIFDLQANLTTDGFDGYAMINRSDVVVPTGILFSRLLGHLVLGSVYAAPVTTGAGGVWSVLTEGPTHATLLVVNTNLSHPLRLRLSSLFINGSRGTVREWYPGLSLPTNVSGKLASYYVVPIEGMLLVTVLRGSVHGPILGTPPDTESGNAAALRAPLTPPVAVGRLSRSHLEGTPADRGWARTSRLTSESRG
ncbi:MAG TPA: hypothetical protein VFF67_01015 [Thermoplasmata archaeon]|nr:hypothetical protein [Thermoplasmata archaeon]